MAALIDSTHPHILLATDRASGANAHLAFATKLGNKLGARITLYHAVPPISLVVNAALADNRADANETVEDVTRALTEVASTLAADRPVNVEVVEASDAREAILAAAQRLKADLIVLPTHGRSGVSRAVLGSTAEQVLRDAKVPVLLLTENMLDSEQQPAHNDGPMLIATDLSPVSVEAHLPAVALAHRLGLPIRLLSVVTDPVPVQLSTDEATLEPKDQQMAIDARTKRLHKLALALDSHAPIEVEAQVEVNPVETIIRRAEELHAPLLVMTTHGRRGVLRMLQGSVAEQVVRRATTPVLIMPTPQ
ncbi:MAG: nucleotide-binding universal stress UspA family protein [Planctomycetota bacterium]|jgi:nucleotide-binding universal stress UspA family protein